MHRLLQNTVGANDYVLLTDACLPDVAPRGLDRAPGVRDLRGSGEVSGRAWLPRARRPRRGRARSPPLLWTKQKQKARWTCGILRDEVLVRLGIKRRPGYRNVPTGAALGLSDRLSGLMMLAVMPLLLPFTLLQNAIAVLRGAPREEDLDEHPLDRGEPVGRAGRNGGEHDRWDGCGTRCCSTKPGCKLMGWKKEDIRKADVNKAMAQTIVWAIVKGVRHGASGVGRGGAGGGGRPDPRRPGVGGDRAADDRNQLRLRGGDLRRCWRSPWETTPPLLLALGAILGAWR